MHPTQEGRHPPQTIQPLRFKFTPTTENTHPYLRGVKTLTEIFKDPTVSKRVTDLYVCPGHFVFLLDGSKTLCVFDFVKSGIPSRLSESQEEVLWKDIAGNLEEKILPVSEVLLQRYKDKVVLVRFHQGTGIFHLIIVFETGSIDVWDWSDQKWIWRLRGKTPLSDTKRSLLLAGYIPENNQKREKHFIFWIEKHGLLENLEFKLFLGQFKFSQDGQVLPSETCHELDSITTPIIDCLHGVDGFWLIPKEKDKIFFWSFVSRTLYNASLKTTPELANCSVVFYLSHPITNEVVSLTDSGKVIVCAYNVKQASLRVVVVSTLTEWNPLGIYQVDAMHHLLVLYYENEAKIYEIRSGTLVGTAQLPFRFSTPQQGNHLWKQAKRGDMPNGIWNIEGLYQLRSRTITEIANQITLKNSRNVSHAAKLCKDWGLNRWHAKYLLDIISQAQQEGSCEEVITACAALLPSFQNPSLVLAILSQSNVLPSFMVDELEYFQKKFNGIDLNREKYIKGGSPYSQSLPNYSTGPRTTVRSREASRLAFHYHTNLNVTLMPVLNSYLDLRGTPHLDVRDKINSTTQIISSLTPDQVLQLSATKLEIYSEIEPEIMLEKLRTAMGISDKILQKISDHYKSGEPSGSVNLEHTPLNNTIFHPEESLPGIISASGIRQSEIISYFESLVRLYYGQNPHLLVPFVDVVHHAFLGNRTTPSTMRTHFHRALDVLPPTEDKNSENFDARVSARVMLLDRVGELAQALLLLLSLGREYWDKALNFVRNKMDRKVDHGELFHILFMHCLQCPVSEISHFSEIWDLMPKQLLSLDLISLFQLRYPPPENFVTTTVPGKINFSEQGRLSTSLRLDSWANGRPDRAELTNGILAREDEHPLAVLKPQLIGMFKKEKPRFETLTRNNGKQVQ